LAYIIPQKEDGPNVPTHPTKAAKCRSRENLFTELGAWPHSPRPKLRRVACLPRNTLRTALMSLVPFVGNAAIVVVYK
jgi:hypothetical protein